MEDINSCGGELHAKKELIEVKTASPEAYVKENGRFPILQNNLISIQEFGRKQQTNR